MSEYFFTSDTHFAHSTLLKFYDHRAALGSADGVDEEMIKRWNARVGHNDVVYHLGDFSMGRAARTKEVISQLNGKIILIPGNHDKLIHSDESIQRMFYQIAPMYHEVTIDRQHIVLCHFPIWEWHRIHYGSWHLHGHLHGKPHEIPGKIFDVGVDGNDLCVYHISEVEKYMLSKPTRTHK